MPITATNQASEVQNIPWPLEIYTSTPVADMVSEAGDKFTIMVGLEKEVVAQLKKLSLDKNDLDIQINTSDLERFGTQPYEAWYAKHRTPFALIHKESQALAGLVWIGPKQPFLMEKDANWCTLAWRSYHPFRGKGLMKEFVAFSMDFYHQKFPQMKPWVVLQKENIKSMELAKKLGMNLVEKASDENRLVFAKE